MLYPLSPALKLCDKLKVYGVSIDKEHSFPLWHFFPVGSSLHLLLPRGMKLLIWLVNPEVVHGSPASPARFLLEVGFLWRACVLCSAPGWEGESSATGEGKSIYIWDRSNSNGSSFVRSQLTSPGRVGATSSGCFCIGFLSLMQQLWPPAIICLFACPSCL